MLDTLEFIYTIYFFVENISGGDTYKAYPSAIYRRLITGIFEPESLTSNLLHAIIHNVSVHVVPLADVL